MQQGKLSILFPYQERIAYQPLSDETLHDLAMDSICEAVAHNDKEKAIITHVLCNITSEACVSQYRTAVFEDIITHKEMRDKLVKLLDHVKFLNDYGAVRRQSDEATGLWDLLHRLDEINDYIATIDAIGACLSQEILQSEGLLNLQQSIRAIWQDSGFDELKQDITALKADTDNLKSITVGINLNERFEAISLGLISVNAKSFTRSGILRNFSDALIRKDHLQAEAGWNGDMHYQPCDGLLDNFAENAGNAVTRVTMKSNPLMAATLAAVPNDTNSRDLPRKIDSALNNLLSITVRKLREVLNRHVTVSIREISDLIPELMYYVRWAEYVEALQMKGWSFSRAQAIEQENEPYAMTAEGFYNLKLIATEPPERVVVNNLQFDAHKRVYLLTGANRGGKTTVTQAIGQLFVLGQGGIRVPAEQFRFVPIDGIFTHFPADEDKTLDLGRLGEECKRFKELYTMSTERSLLLLNETFSTTSFEEGYYIATDAVRALLHKGVRTIYNTHMHKLAQQIEILNSDECSAKAISLVVKSSGGERSFRIAIEPPEGLSYAHDIAVKYGITYDDLLKTTGNQ